MTIRMQETDFSRSLQDLESSDWGEPEPNDTWMVKIIHALRRKALRSLTDEELRLAVSQRVGIPFTLDLALDRLASDPLLEGGNYPGDILSALIRADPEVWSERPQLKERFAELYAQALQAPPEEISTFRDSLSLPANDVKH